MSLFSFFLDEAHIFSIAVTLSGRLETQRRVDGWMQTFDSISQRAEGFRGADHRCLDIMWGLRSWSLLIPRNVCGSSI
ncbi:unnamed protein product [Musa acuminata subsp. malaccensis]|uniref:(wild Malaysian banana) hypothetical protein n=1 Tax=Musa acuminata subsp. malaccensis TaxID=214687 RepID=A0A804LB44_MUSAM|nr:unnamed protein product [Musa acuminata subsp. malaccensis]